VSYLDALFLALIQGLTEFLPISSSAHLILFSETIGNFPENIFYDVSLHLWRDVKCDAILEANGVPFRI